MTRKIYRTAQGKNVDLGALQLQNESVRAVGNMKVNARGDQIDSQNQSINSRNQRISKQYNRQVTNVSDDEVVVSRRRATADEFVQTESTIEETVTVDETVELQNTQPPAEEPTASESGGLAAAIARARQIKQEPLKTPKQIKQETPGVSKI